MVYKIIFGTFLALAYAASASRVQPQPRLNGGQLAPATQFPQFVSLRMLDLAIPHFCSGTILSADWIITAAVCVGERTNITRITIVVGTIRMQDIGDRYAVHSVVRHPRFTGRTADWLRDNVALLKTMRPIIFYQRVQPVALHRNVVDGGHLAMMGGWKTVRRTRFLGIWNFQYFFYLLLDSVD